MLSSRAFWGVGVSTVLLPSQGPLLKSYFFFFLGLHLWHIEVPRLGVKSELQLPAYATATATQDLSRISDLHHRSQQHRILNPLMGPGIESASSWILVRFVSTETGTPESFFYRNGAPGCGTRKR